MLKSVNISRQHLPERIAEQIKQLIADREWKVGDKIPNEFEMGEQLQVGRGTIREAVKILVSQNILEVRRGCGTFVSERTGISDDPLGLWLIEDKDKLALDLSEVRLMLEPEIARLAAMRCTGVELDSLVNAQKQLEKKIYQGEDHTQEDIIFHRTLAQISKNEVVTKLIPIIQSAIHLFIKITDYSLNDETIQTHRSIVNAIEKKNPENAFEGMKQHLNINQARAKELIELNKLLRQNGETNNEVP